MPEVTLKTEYLVEGRYNRRRFEDKWEAEHYRALLAVQATNTIADYNVATLFYAAEQNEELCADLIKLAMLIQQKFHLIPKLCEDDLEELANRRSQPASEAVSPPSGDVSWAADKGNEISDDDIPF